MLRDILLKELKRVFNDRRLVFSAIILPAISIFVVYTIMGNMFTNMMNNIDEHTSVVYVQNAPEGFEGSIDYEELNMNVEFIDESTDVQSIKDNILEGDVDLMVEFEDGFIEKVDDYKNQDPAEINTFYNPSKEYSSNSRKEFINNVLEPYRNEILTSRFGDIKNIKVFDIDVDNESSKIVDEKKASGRGFSMIIPMLVAIILFSAAMGIGMDTIAGEKERGTMATLLLTPVKRKTIALGKVIGLGIVAIISALVSFGAILASMPYASSMLTGGSSLNLGSLKFSGVQLLQLLLIMITLVGIFVGLICLLSVRARTVKEAGTYVTPVFMVVILTAFSTIFGGGTTKLYHFAIPIYGSVSALKAAFTFELTMNQFLVTVISAFIVSLILIKLITITFNDEKVMLNA